MSENTLGQQAERAVKTDRMLNACTAAREMTVAELIDERIRHHNMEISRLISLTHSTPSSVLAMPANTVRSLYAVL